jgi:hypothetical protein
MREPIPSSATSLAATRVAFRKTPLTMGLSR